MSRGAIARIDLAALRGNLARIRALAPCQPLMAVVKADAYGHGLERVARALDDADAFGVAAIADGQRLRAAGCRQRIVVLSGFDEAGDLPEARRLDLDLVVHHTAQIDLIAADPDRRRLRLWLKLDTGMHRLGLAPTQLAGALERLRGFTNVDPAIVVMSHYASSDDADQTLTRAQLGQFLATCSDFALPRSLANSAAILAAPEFHPGWLRAGGLLYGLSVIEGKTGADLGFTPVMRLSGKLIAINRVGAGEGIGYGASFRSEREQLIGVVAIGYGDGYPRHAPTGTPVRLRGRETRLLGRVSMDLLTIDLADFADAAIGDEVLLWGPELPVERIAALAGTISYELTCGVTRRVMFLESDRQTTVREPS